MILDQIRAEQLQMPKAERFRLNDLLSKLELKRATYYDERKRISNKFDKYHEVKRQMMIIAQKYSMRNRFTAGYRRIQVELERLGIHLAGDVKGGFKLSFYGGLKMYDLGGLRTDRC